MKEVSVDGVKKQVSASKLVGRKPGIGGNKT